MTLAILPWPNKALDTVCDPVPSSWFNGPTNSEFTEMLVEMANLCHREHGLALAANQVGITKRFFVIPPNKDLVGQCHIDAKPVPQPSLMVNPIISAALRSRAVDMEEGCLSYPGVYVTVSRPDLIYAEWQDNRGQTFNGVISGLLARVVQHEVEHLEGNNYLRHMNGMQRERLLRSLKSRRKKGK